MLFIYVVPVHKMRSRPSHNKERRFGYVDICSYMQPVSMARKTHLIQCYTYFSPKVQSKCKGLTTAK